MRISLPAKTALVGVVAAALLASAATAATAATPAGSGGPWYVTDAGTEQLVPAGTTLAWDAAVVGTPDKTDPYVTYQGSADATDVVGFLSRVGDEKNINAWIATGFGGFKPGTMEVLQPNSSPGSMINGNNAGARAAGGDFSIGVAFVKNNGVTLAEAGVFYTVIHAEPGTGRWTFDVPTEGTTPVEPPAGAQTGEIGLSATTAAPTDGALSLVVPAGASATIGNPTVVGGTSTSTGKLGEFSVKDARYATHAGWTLTSTVADFTADAETIDKKQLGMSPKVVSSTAERSAAGVSVGADQTAGSAAWPATFGQAGSSAQVGDTVFDADLTFVAPAGKPAGTYTSKMTLTLVSK